MKRSLQRQLQGSFVGVLACGVGLLCLLMVVWIRRSTEEQLDYRVERAASILAELHRVAALGRAQRFESMAAEPRYRALARVFTMEGGEQTLQLHADQIDLRGSGWQAFGLLAPSGRIIAWSGVGEDEIGRRLSSLSRSAFVRPVRIGARAVEVFTVPLRKAADREPSGYVVVATSLGPDILREYAHVIGGEVSLVSKETVLATSDPLASTESRRSGRVALVPGELSFRVAIDERQVTQPFYTILKVMLVVGMMILMAGGLMASYLARRIDRPIRAIASRGDSLARELSAVSQDLESSAQESCSHYQQVSRAVSQVSTNIDTMATFVEQMNAGIGDIAGNTAEVATVVSSSMRLLEGLITSMEKLEESGKEIEDVLQIMVSIARRTDLLALNAMIEATKAGAAGKGFGVVAEEVKRLANQAAEGSDDIAGRVGVIRTDTKRAVARLGAVTETIGRLRDLQSGISAAVEQQSVATEEISCHVAEGAKRSADIAGDVHSVAARSTGKAERIREAAAHLRELTLEMRLLVGAGGDEDGVAGRRSRTSSHGVFPESDAHLATALRRAPERRVSRPSSGSRVG